MEIDTVSITYPIPDKPKRIHIIDTNEKAQSAVEFLLRYDILGFDVETYNSRLRHVPAFEPVDGARMRLNQWATPDGDAFVFDLYKVSKTYLYSMFPNTSYLLVGQNLVFEMTFLMWELGIYDYGPIWDTMIAAQILTKGDVSPSDGFYVKVGLDSIAKRELGVTVPKDEQASHWYREDLSTSQIQYAARDAQVVLPIWQKQREKLKEQSQVRTAEIDFGAVPPVAWMKNTGIGLNADAWEYQYEVTKQQIQGVKEKLWDRVGIQNTLFENMPTIKLTSRPQMMDAFKRLGIVIPLDRKTGEPTLSTKLLKPLEHLWEEVQWYVEYVKLDKALSSFGLSWIKGINEVSGRLHGSLKIIGAETGRMSGVKPNLMQVPKKNVYRNAFEAREGWVFVDTDYSQCELRILAERCRDPKLLEAFDNDYDLHRFSASLIFKVPMELVTDEQRGIAKNLNFGIVYGIGAGKFALDSGLTLDEGKAIMDYYLREAYVLMGRHLEEQAHNILINHLTSRTMSGRARRYRGDIQDKEVRAQLQRHAKNQPIQGTNADITKRALRLTYNRVVPNRNKCAMVIPVHDEILGEARADYAREYQWHQEQAMLEAEREFLKRVPCKVDTTITRVWCKEATQAQKAEAEAMIA